MLLRTSLTAAFALAVSVASAPASASVFTGDDVFLVEPGTVEYRAAAPGVLANDRSDPAGPLTASSAYPPAHGPLTLQADGGLVYRPDPGFHGLDSWGYRATAADGSSEAGVATMVVDRLPVARPDAVSVAPDVETLVRPPGVLANDEDGDGDRLLLELLDAPIHGRFVLYADGSFTYAPVTGYTGTDAFRYRLNDNIWPGEPTTVTITVGQAPAPGGPAPGGSGGTPGAPGPAGGGGGAAARGTLVVPRAFRVDRAGRGVLGLSCRGAAPCTGRFRIATSGGRAIVSGAYDLPAGRRSNTTIRVGPKGRAVLRARHGRSLRARLVVTPDGGRAATTAIVVTAPRTLRR